MKQFLFVTALLSMSLVSSTRIVAAEATSTDVESSTNETTTSKENQSHSDAANQEENHSQEAAWMLESAQVANDYVDTIDKGNYAQSWTKGDQIFQHTITKEEWTKALNQSRKPLGKVISRKVKDQRPAMNPQGLPRGAYMVVEYDTSFEKAPLSGELLTLRRGSDGTWRVLTYQVN